MGAVALFYDLIIIAFSGNQPGVQDTCIQQVLYQIGLEGPEDIACPEVDPDRAAMGVLFYCFIIKSGKPVSGGFIGGAVCVDAG